MRQKNLSYVNNTGSIDSKLHQNRHVYDVVRWLTSPQKEKVLSQAFCAREMYIYSSTSFHLKRPGARDFFVHGELAIIIRISEKTASPNNGWTSYTVHQYTHHTFEWLLFLGGKTAQSTEYVKSNVNLFWQKEQLPSSQIGHLIYPASVTPVFYYT